MASTGSKDAPKRIIDADYEPERKSCPRCGDSVLVNRDGSLRKHQRWDPGAWSLGGKWVQCVAISQ